MLAFPGMDDLIDFIRPKPDLEWSASGFACVGRYRSIFAQDRCIGEHRLKLLPLVAPCQEQDDSNECTDPGDGRYLCERQLSLPIRCCGEALTQREKEHSSNLKSLFPSLNRIEHWVVGLSLINGRFQALTLWMRGV